MFSLFSGAEAVFDKLVENVTSNLKKEADGDSFFRICDSIRQGRVSTRYAVSSIKNRLSSENLHVVLNALQILKYCVKYCGSPFHFEVASEQFVKDMTSFIRETKNEVIRNKAVEFIQICDLVLKDDPKYQRLPELLNFLKWEGYKFQILKECDKMFMKDADLDWSDGRCCFLCKAEFTLFRRRHHCRYCWQMCCNDCSPRNYTIPFLGVRQSLRVWDTCYEKLENPESSSTSRAFEESQEDSLVELEKSLTIICGLLRKERNEESDADDESDDAINFQRPKQTSSFHNTKQERFAEQVSSDSDEEDLNRVFGFFKSEKDNADKSPTSLNKNQCVVATNQMDASEPKTIEKPTVHLSEIDCKFMGLVMESSIEDLQLALALSASEAESKTEVQETAKEDDPEFAENLQKALVLSEVEETRKKEIDKWRRK